MGKPVAAVLYKSPDLIPANLKKVALVLDVTAPRGLVVPTNNLYFPNNILPRNMQEVGAVVFGPGDTIPGSLQQRALPPIPAWDTAKRADSALSPGNLDSGQSWTVLAGTWGISGGKLYSVSDADADLCEVDGGAADGILSCRCSGTVNNAGSIIRCPVLAFRLSDANNYLFGGIWAQAVRLYKSDGGVTSSLATIAMTLVDGQQYQVDVVMSGNLVSIYVDEVSMLTWLLTGTDTKYNAYTKHGLRLVKAGAPATAARYDLFRFQAAGPKTVVFDGKPAAPVPSAGSEQVLNGGFEVDTSGWVTNGPSYWLVAGATITKSTAQQHSGLASGEIQVSPSTQYAGASYSLGNLAPAWYTASAWYRGSANPAQVFIGENGAVSATMSITPSGAWQQATLVWLATGNPAYVGFRTTTNSTLDIYIDDVSVKPLSSVLTLAADPGRRDVLVDSHPTLTPGTQCGHAIWVDDATNPKYGVFAYQDGTTAYLNKLVNGTWTTLISAAATYADAKNLRTISRQQNGVETVGLFYDTGSGLVQIGTDQTITDAWPLSGTKVCAFSTLASNNLGEITIQDVP